MPREVSPEGRTLIQQFEGLSLTAYVCPAGKWTIGYGHTAGVQPGDKITTAQAGAMLAADLVAFAQGVERSVGTAPTSQHEFDAMTSLAFNIGVGAFQGSTVARLHKAGDTNGAAGAFGLWRKITDPKTGKLVDSAGLMARRARETAFYLTPDAPSPKAMPQAVAAPPSAASSKTVIAGGAAVVTGAASVADQLTQISPTIDTINHFGMSMQSFLKLGVPILSVISVAAAAYFLWRYIQKKRRGEVMST